MSVMKNIKLDNELSTHLTKRLNRLSTFGFFKVLYRVSSMKLMGISFLIALFCIPTGYVLLSVNSSIASLTGSLPVYGPFGLSAGNWLEVSSYIESGTLAIYLQSLKWIALSGLMLTFALSGILAVIRDSFWTGSIKVFYSFFKGLKANFFYALGSSAIISIMAVGLLAMNMFIMPTMEAWLGVTLFVLMCIVSVMITIYLLILCSITVTYKQGFGRSILDSWYLYISNLVPHIFKFVVAMLPLVLYFIMPASFQMIMLVLLLMMGLFVVPFVWQTHMMKIFAMFHPVAVNKKGETKKTATRAVPAKTNE